MTPERLEQLRARRATIAESRDALMALPDQERRGPRGPLTTWERSLRETDALLASLDSAIVKGSTKAVRRAASRSIQSPAVADAPKVVLARVPRGNRGEIRVTVSTWKKRRIVDIRVWFRPHDEDEFVPSSRGVGFDASKLEDIIEGLTLARQHL